ncbi:MAG: hypothetical protein CMO81_05995, partial [Waddliaceae bacterium]|nr:hypothetical protein [Waddliaceae bacterium]
GHTSRAYFLLHLCTAIQQRATELLQVENSNDQSLDLYRRKQINAEAVSEISKNFPQFWSTHEEKTRFIDLLISDIDDRDNTPFSEQINYSVYLAASCGFQNQGEESFIANPLLQDPKIFPQFMLALSRIRLGADSGILGGWVENLLHWSQSAGGATLRELSKNHLQTFSSRLDDWVELQEGETPQKDGLWVQDQEHAMIWKKGESIIDMDTLQIVRVNGKAPKGIQANLPNKILQSKAFQVLKPLMEKGKIDSFCKAGKNPGEYVFTFHDRNGKNYRALYCVDKPEVMIEREVDNQVLGISKRGNTWLRFQLPESSTESLSLHKRLLKNALKLHSNLNGLGDALIQQIAPKPKPLNSLETELETKGLWVSPKNPSKALVFLHDDAREDGILRIKLNKGNLVSAKSLNGKEVLTLGDKEQVDLPFSSKRTLLLKQAGKKGIQEIRLLDQNICLERDKDAKWKVVGEKYDGWTWVMGATGSPSTDNLIADIGSHISQVGLVPKNEKTLETKLILWPHEVKGDAVHRQPKWNSLELEHDLTSPSLSITIQKDGTQEGDASAYLYLAYHASLQHNYGNAKYLIRMAQNQSVSSESDKAALERCWYTLLSLPENSQKARKNKLQILLASRRMILNKQGIQEFSQDKSQEFLIYSSKISQLITDYQRFADKKEKDSWKEGLTPQDILSMDYICREGLQSLHAPFNPVSDFTDLENSLWINSPSKLTINALGSILLSKMKSPHANPGEIITQLGYSNPDLLLGQFFTLWNHIINQKLESKDLASLMGPIQGYQQMNLDLHNVMDKVQDKTSNVLAVQEADQARQMLLALSSLDPEDRENLKFDLNYLKSQTRLLPRSIPGAAIRFAWDVLRPEKLRSISTFDLDTSVITKNFSQVVEKAKPINIEESEVSAAIQSSFKSQLNKKEKLDSEGLEKALEENPNSFGPIVASLWKNDHIGMLALLKVAGQSGLVSIDDFLQAVESQYQVNLLKEARLQTMSERAQNLQNELRNPAPSTKWEELQQEKVAIDLTDSRLLAKYIPEASIDEENADAPYEEATKELLEGFSKACSNEEDVLHTMEKYEDELICAGIEEAKRKLSKGQEQNTKTHLDPDQLEEALDNDVYKTFHKAFLRQEEIFIQLNKLTHGQKEKLPSSLKELLDGTVHVEEEQILNQVLNTYQRALFDDMPELESLITEYLIMMIEAKTFDTELRKRIADLRILKEQENAPEEEIQRLQNAFFSDYKHLSRRDRYLDANTLTLKDPRFNRKFLVAECRSGKMLREEQISMIRSMESNPNQWYQLRMGLGKTSFILPLLLLLLAEKGNLPVGILKDEVIVEHFSKLDRTTRMMLEEAAVLFHFNFDAPHSAATLAEEYVRLLQAKKDGGYIVSTIHDFASMEHRLIQDIEKMETFLGEKNLKEFLKGEETEWDQLSKKLEDRSLFQELRDLRLKHHYLIKIRSLLEGNEEYFGFSTQKEIDEVDDVANVRNEDNLGMDGPHKLDSTILNAADELFTVLDESQDEVLLALKEKMNSRDYSTFKPSYIKNTILTHLVSEWFDKYSNQLPCKNRDHILKYLCVENSEVENAPLPEGYPLKSERTKEEFYKLLRLFIDQKGTKDPSTELMEDLWYFSMAAPNDPQIQEATDLLKHSYPESFKKLKEQVAQVSHLSAMKRMIEAAPGVLSATAGVDVDIKESDGFTVGPQASGKEKQDKVFGDEYDVVFNHYWLYACKLKNNLFLKKAIKHLRETKPGLYYEISKEASQKNISLFDFLNLPENRKYRLKILKNEVLNARLVGKFRKQAVFNAQEFLSNAGGMTGTLDRSVLPEQDGKIEDSPKVVEGETLLHLQKMKAKVTVAKGSEEIIVHIKNSIQGGNVRAVINEGMALMDSRALTELLRNSNEGQNRPYVFVDPLSGHTMIWETNKEFPERIHDELLKDRIKKEADLRKNIVYIYSNADIIGTDYAIPTGEALYISGPATKMSRFLQGLWRCRGLGKEHKIQFLIPDTLADRVRATNKLNEEEEITSLHLAQDIKIRSLEEKAGLNLKEVCIRASSIIKKSLRNEIEQAREVEDDISYWSPEHSLRLTIDTFFDQSIKRCVENVFIESRDVNFLDDYEPTHMEDVEKYMNSVYETELLKLDLVKNKWNKEKIQYENVPNYEEHYQNKIKTFEEQLKKIEQDLKSHQESFKRDLEEHKKRLPSKVPSNGSALASSHAQVQQQSQVQLQLQLQVQLQLQLQLQQQLMIGDNSDKKEMVKYEKWEPMLDGETLSYYQKPIEEGYDMIGGGGLFGLVPAAPVYRPAPEPTKHIQGLIGNDIFLQQTVSVKRMREEIGVASGEAIAGIFVCGNQVLLISHSDYEWVISRYIKRQRELHNEVPMAVYQILNGKRTGTGTMTTMNGYKTPELEKSPELRGRIAAAKFMLGYIDYTETEKEDLSLFFSNLEINNQLDLETWLKECKNEDLSALYQQLNCQNDLD